MLIQQRLAGHAGQALVLQIVSAGVGGAAQQEGTLVVVLEIGQDRVKTHVGRQGDGIRPVTLKGFDGVLLGGAAYVAALGVQDDGHLRRNGAHVGHEFFQLVFGAVGREVGDLWLEGYHQVRRGIDDGSAEIKNLSRIALDGGGEFGRLGVQPDTQHRMVLALGSAQLV